MIRELTKACLQGLHDYIKDLAERYRQIANSSHSKLDFIPPTVLIVENCPTKSKILNDIFLPLTELGDTGPKPFVIGKWKFWVWGYGWKFTFHDW